MVTTTTSGLADVCNLSSQIYRFAALVYALVYAGSRVVCLYLDYFLVILGSLVVEPAFFFLAPPRAGFLLGGAAEAVSFDFAFGLGAAAFSSAIMIKQNCGKEKNQKKG